MTQTLPTDAQAARRFRLLLVGVGGQGVLTAARLLGEAALFAGVPVAVGQLHGMSQRGGSVESGVLFGPGHGSFVEQGSADVVLGLEPLEVLRARPRMSSATRVVVSTGTIVPYTLAQAGRGYPPTREILAKIRKVTPHVVEIDGPALAEEAGSAKALNVVMLGAAAGLGVLPLDADAIWDAIERLSPPRHLETSHRAFALGRKAVTP